MRHHYEVQQHRRIAQDCIYVPLPAAASGGATAGARTVVSSAVKGTAISATGGATTSNSTGTLPWRVQSAYKSFGGGHILLQLQVGIRCGLLDWFLAPTYAAQVVLLSHALL
jgi:hypothetical protein